MISNGISIVTCVGQTLTTWYTMAEIVYSGHFLVGDMGSLTLGPIRIVELYAGKLVHQHHFSENLRYFRDTFNTHRF
jgi:hypothetical protein